MDPGHFNDTTKLIITRLPGIVGCKRAGPEITDVDGRRDNVYGVTESRDYIVPALKRDGYNVTYYEFDGPHWVPDPVVRRILEWLKE